jgi:hypothetical protein
MKVDIKVLTKLGPTFGVYPLEGVGEKVKQFIANNPGDKAPADMDPILVGAGYQWNDGSNNYTLQNQVIYYIAEQNVCIWLWDNSVFRPLKDAKVLQKWVQGDEKYPDGKANKFIEIYTKAVGGDVTTSNDERGVDNGPINFNGTGVRSDDAEPKNVDPTDALIAQLTKKAGLRKTLPSDDMITIGLKAKKEGNQKLLKFLSTIKPLNENYIKKSALTELIQHIVKKVVSEMNVKEETTTASISPITTPFAFKKKNVKEDNYVGNIPKNDTSKVKSSDSEEAIAVAKKIWGNGVTSATPHQTSNGGTYFKVDSGDTYYDFIFKSRDGKWWRTSEGGIRSKFIPVPTDTDIRISEMTTTSHGEDSSAGTPGYNIPSAFSTKGGSKKGIEVSAALGYKLTPTGKKDMDQKADKLL